MLDLGSETQLECMLSESFPCTPSKQRTMKLDCSIIRLTRVPVKRKMFYTFACSYLYNYNNSDCEAYICRTFNNSGFIMSFATGKQATNIQIGPPVTPFSPIKTTEKCSVPSNPEVHSLKTSKLHPTSEDSDELETTPMDELVAPSLCTVEDADVTCISDEEEEQQPSYESAEESDFTPSDMQSEDGDTSDDLDEKDEKTEADEEIVRKFLPPYYSYHITHFKSLATHSFLGASPFAFEAELQVNLKNESEMRAWVAQLGEHQKTTWRVTRGQKGKGKRIKCSLYFHCQHHTKSHLKGKKRLANEGKPTGPRDKNTICPSILRIKLAGTQHLSPTNLYYSHPCKVFLCYTHNHPITSAAPLSHRDIAETTKIKLYQYFSNGDSPAAAIHKLRHHLKDKRKHGYEVALSDRRCNPRKSDVTGFTRNGSKKILVQKVVMACSRS